MEEEQKQIISEALNWNTSLTDAQKEDFLKLCEDLGLELIKVTHD